MAVAEPCVGDDRPLSGSDDRDRAAVELRRADRVAFGRHEDPEAMKSTRRSVKADFVPKSFYDVEGFETSEEPRSLDHQGAFGALQRPLDFGQDHRHRFTQSTVIFFTDAGGVEFKDRAAVHADAAGETAERIEEQRVAAA